MKKTGIAVVLSVALAVFSYGKQVSINMNLGVEGMDSALQMEDRPVQKKHVKKQVSKGWKTLKAVMAEDGIELSDGRVIPVSYNKALFPYPKVEILEPVGAKVVLSQDGEEDFKGEIPLLWKDAEIDAYIKMTVYEEGGTMWSVKFQAKKQRDLTIGGQSGERVEQAPQHRENHGHEKGLWTKHFELDKKVYEVGEGFSVRFHDMPGNQSDWISVVPAGVPANYWGNWQYINGAKDGVFPVPGQAAGKYEVRAYYNHPDGGFAIQDSISFDVVIK